MFNRLWLFTQIVASNWNASMNAFSKCDNAKRESKSLNKHMLLCTHTSTRVDKSPSILRISFVDRYLRESGGHWPNFGIFRHIIKWNVIVLVQQFVYYFYSCCCCFQWRCCSDCCCCCLLMLLKSVSDYLVVLLLLRLGYVEPSAHIGIKCNRIGYQHQLFMCDYVYYIYIHIHIYCADLVVRFLKL